ncbi:hypothetical protein ACIGMX_34445 [Streptomyces aquilus]|uniref:hypothetical protein n=1 Tax=Streptomyces aquilus TaxID=2548456 RepID=UPI0037D620A5
MPAKRAQDPDPEVTPPAPEPETPAAAKPTPDEVPAGRLPAGVYEFTGPVPTQYLEVPLTARPAVEGRPATDDEPEVPASPATVFDWPLSAPDDGRWKPTRKKPNQQPDNAPADPEGE